MPTRIQKASASFGNVSFIIFPHQRGNLSFTNCSPFLRALVAVLGLLSHCFQSRLSSEVIERRLLEVFCSVLVLRVSRPFNFLRGLCVNVWRLGNLNPGSQIITLLMAQINPTSEIPGARLWSSESNTFHQRTPQHSLYKLGVFSQSVTFRHSRSSNMFWSHKAFVFKIYLYK